MRSTKLAVPFVVGAMSLACSSSATELSTTDAEVSGDAETPGDESASAGPETPAPPPEEPKMPATPVERMVYGKSALGEELVVHRITPPQPNGKKALLVFGEHGFEDAWAQDGRALFAIGEEIVQYYGAHLDALAGWTLYVVPSANPDGMEHGVNNEREGNAGAYGRCTSQGKDVNRNFSKASFPEHDALKSLLDESKPSVLVDFHGWYNCYYGNSKVGDYFADAFNTKYTGKPSKYCYVRATGTMDCGATLGVTFHRNTSITHDLVAEWASSQRGIPAALVEYPAPDFDTDGAYDTVRDAKSGALTMQSKTLGILVERTRVGLDQMFAQFLAK